MRKAQFFSMELPEVLTSEEEKRVIERLPDFEAQNILVERNLRLVYYICQSYVNNYVVRAEILEDLFSVGTLGLIKASHTYSLERNATFSTYATKCIQNEIGMYLKKDRRKEKAEMHLEDIIATDNNDKKLTLIDMLSDDKNTFIQYEEIELISRLLTAIINRYSQQERAVFYYTMSGKNQTEIGKFLSLSQSYVSRVQKRVFLKNTHLLGNKPAYITRISVDYLGDEIILATFQKQYFTEELYLFLKNNQDKFYILKSYKDLIKVVGFMQDIFFILAELSRLALI